MTKFKELSSKLEKLSFGKVIEITGLAKQEADNLFNLYKKNYIVRGPCKELNGGHNYVLSFELNPYKTQENDLKVTR